MVISQICLSVLRIRKPCYRLFSVVFCWVKWKGREILLCCLMWLNMLLHVCFCMYCAWLHLLALPSATLNPKFSLQELKRSNIDLFWFGTILWLSSVQHPVIRMFHFAKSIFLAHFYFQSAGKARCIVNINYQFTLGNSRQCTDITGTPCGEQDHETASKEPYLLKCCGCSHVILLLTSSLIRGFTLF